MLALPGHTSKQGTGNNKKPLDRKTPIQVRKLLLPLGDDASLSCSGAMSCSDKLRSYSAASRHLRLTYYCSFRCSSNSDHTSNSASVWVGVSRRRDDA